ncbi:ATP-binding protein [Atribacter laminatus]|jgi:Pyruvate/2-oxoacid:ferredoxin oxidoreductase delta subunit|uniref:Ferredoxin-1 n=1 Tax=Atribacter laminatus TaxID=2847778 RepID=A0A7T1AM30_ATRLM|nr:4Fe-4S binding protein [Atribacter laminatus]QPM68452.1 Ferredoxin-1 [Atribacter laminatus]
MVDGRNTIRRNIIKIDKEKCNGCGQCVLACAEGAIQITDGKARLVKDSYCDGLGACIGECPTGALQIEERIAEPFDESFQPQPPSQPEPLPACGCPGTMAQSLKGNSFQQKNPVNSLPVKERQSLLENWPVQLTLVPTEAPYLKNASLVIAADCVPFTYPAFHEKFLTGKVLLIGCPKLDNVDLYEDKLAQIFRQNRIKELNIVYMEVPCCRGLIPMVQNALLQSGAKVPVKINQISIKGEILKQEVLKVTPLIDNQMCCPSSAFFK